MSKDPNTRSSPIKKNTITKQDLGIRLREAREYLGLSQEEVAQNLKIPRTALSHIESGRRRIDAIELQKISGLYKLPISYFIDEKGHKKAAPRDIAHLARAMSVLSRQDREEVKRFAEYLRARATQDNSTNE